MICLPRKKEVQDSEVDPARPSSAHFRLSRVSKSLTLTTITAAILYGCGGGSSGSGAGGQLVAEAPAPAPVPVPTPAPIPAPAPIPIPVPSPLPVTSCYDGGVVNTVGIDDPLYVNSWHLKNTGPTQAVSAVTNNGVAGIDANVENVHKAGAGCTGKGVTIAIVDNALEIGHEDYAGNILAGKSFNFAKNTDDPSPPPNEPTVDHGTGVAGVAAARGWNGKGSRGTAPFASMVGYPTVGVTPAVGTSSDTMNYLAFGATALADATSSVVTLFANRSASVGVFNFSAGSDYGTPTTVDDLDVYTLASKHGTSVLRNGLGAVYFQSAGNEQMGLKGALLADGTKLDIVCTAVRAADAALLGGVIANSAALTCGSPNHEPAGKPYFYQVAAIHNTGVAASYSSSGSSNWITGFGGESGTDEAAIISTDNSGCTSGTNNTANKPSLLAEIGAAITKLIADLFGDASSKDVNCNYTGQMNGTSAAAPSLSGIAALLLEANPQLTWRDVGFILAKTARKVDAGIASGSRAVTFTPSGGSAQNLDEPWLTNSAGFNFQNQYGFGLVDAEAATRLAASYTTPPGRRVATLTAVGTDATTSTVNRVGVNQATVNFANSSAVSGSIQLDLTITNNAGVDVNPGQLQFEITNRATGTKSIVMPAFTSWYVGGKGFKISANGQQKFRLSTNAFYGEGVAGDYVITVFDFSGASGAAGKALTFKPTLTSFSM